MRIDNVDSYIPWARPPFGQAEIQAVIHAMDSGHLTTGPNVEHFEQEMARRMQRRHAIAVANGTAALDLALRSLGITHGDEVIIPALSDIATASAVVLQGATPVFTDIDPRNLCLDPVRAAAHVSLRTRAILCGDLGGNPCDYARLVALCERHSLPLIVNGSQSVGSLFEGRPTLSYGLISTTSFHAVRTMTTIEGGMIFTDDPDIARRLRTMRAQGEDPDRADHYIELGHNFRMTEIQAAIGLAQIERLDELLAQRASLASQYTAAFSPLGLTPPPGVAKAHDSHQLYTLLLPRRDQIAARLAADGIETRVCYPMPLYRQPVFQPLKADFCPQAEITSTRILNLPMYSTLEAARQQRIVDSLRAAIESLVPQEELRKAV